MPARKREKNDRDDNRGILGKIIDRVSLYGLLYVYRILYRLDVGKKTLQEQTMIETKVEIRLPKINFDLTRVFKRAGQTVAFDLKHGIDINKDIAGNEFPALEPETINRKGHEQPLIDLNVLRRSFAVKVEKKNWVTVFIQDKGDPPRDEVGFYLQVDGLETKSGHKNWMLFGISDRARKKIWRDITNEVRRILASARK